MTAGFSTGGSVAWRPIARDTASASACGSPAATAREIASAHGGDLRAESHPSYGTTFTLALPAEALALDTAGVAMPPSRRRPASVG